MKSNGSLSSWTSPAGAAGSHSTTATSTMPTTRPMSAPGPGLPLMGRVWPRRPTLTARPTGNPSGTSPDVRGRAGSLAWAIRVAAYASAPGDRQWAVAPPVSTHGSHTEKPDCMSAEAARWDHARLGRAPALFTGESCGAVLGWSRREVSASTPAVWRWCRVEPRSPHGSPRPTLAATPTGMPDQQSRGRGDG